MMTLDVRRSTPDIAAADAPSKEEIRSLPGTIEWLRRNDLMLETDVEVSGDLELTGVQKHLDGTMPLLFNNVAGYPDNRVITNFFANIEIVDKLFGFGTPKERTAKIAHALTHPLPSEVIASDQAPCQEEVITDDLDVNKYVPAIRHTHLESEITIGSGNSVVVGDYFSGGSHIGAFEDDIHRPPVVVLVADFLRAYVLGDTTAASRLPSDADAPGLLSLRASE